MVPNGLFDIRSRRQPNLFPTPSTQAAAIRTLTGIPEAVRQKKLQQLQDLYLRSQITQAMGPEAQARQKLETGKTEAEIEFLKARSKVLGQPGTVPIYDPETGEIKFEVPKGAKPAPSPIAVIDPETGKTKFMIPRGAKLATAPSEKPLTTEAGKAIANAQQGLKQTGIVFKTLESDPQLFRLASISGVKGKVARANSPRAQALNTAFQESDDIIQRTRSGGAINPQELQFYGQDLGINIFDSNESAINKYVKRAEFLEGVATQIRQGTRVPGKVDAKGNVTEEPQIQQALDTLEALLPKNVSPQQRLQKLQALGLSDKQAYKQMGLEGFTE